VPAPAWVLAEHGRKLPRGFLARPDVADEIVKLHAIRACRAADELERLLEVQAVPLRNDPLGLLDRDSRLQRMLELGTALVRRLRHRKQAADRGSRLFGRAGAQRLDRLYFRPLLQGDSDSKPRGRCSGATLGPGPGDFARHDRTSPRPNVLNVGESRGETMAGGQEERERRAAQNQLLFREVNEQIVNLTERFQAQLSDLDLVCECADPSCTGAIRLGLDDFGRIDRVQNAFLVLRGHEDDRVEDVVDQRDGYVVVRKRNLAARVVERER
jgi:hypothetical protein